jgi:hypothetical protein
MHFFFRWDNCLLFLSFATYRSSKSQDPHRQRGLWVLSTKDVGWLRNDGTDDDCVWGLPLWPCMRELCSAKIPRDSVAHESRTPYCGLGFLEFSRDLGRAGFTGLTRVKARVHSILLESMIARSGVPSLGSPTGMY